MPNSDLKRAFNEDGALKTHVGGQALIEGIMMRGRYNWAVAVREPDGGIYTEEHDLSSGKQKNRWLYWPVVRGCTAFFESLVLGYRALSVAAEHAYDEEDEADETASVQGTGVKTEQVGAGVRSDEAFGSEEATQPAQTVRSEEDARTAEEIHAEEDVPSAGAAPSEAAPQPEDDASDKESSSGFMTGAMALSLVLGTALGVVLFVVAPALLANWMVGEYTEKTLLWNVVDGIWRVAVFIFYIWLIGHMKDINRMFCYHGAEHKTIHCYEHGLPLTPENARQFPCLHVRCGTAFLIMVMIIAIIVYTLTPLNGLIEAWGIPAGAPELILVMVVRVLLMPLIAGISYEITVKWAGTHPENPAVKVILWPGLQMQKLTTHEPDDGMLECAIAAMNLVLQCEEAEAARADTAADVPLVDLTELQP